MIEKIDDIKKAKAQIVEGSLTIWNARLDVLQRSGDIKGALEQMVSPIEKVADQGNCGGCNCGAALGPILPEELAATKKR